MFAEVDTPTSKHGLWTGLGVAGIGSIDGTKGSPLRRDAKGVPGVELTLQDSPRFFALPGFATVLSGFGVDSQKLPLSNAAHVSAEDVAKATLNTTDPKVINSLTQAAKALEKTAGTIDDAKSVLDGLSQAGQVLTVIQTLSAGSVLAASALAVPLAFAWQDKLADGTLEGGRVHNYAVDSGAALNLLKAITARLSSAHPLSSLERKALRADLAEIAAFDAKWNGHADLKKFINQLAPKARFPWDAKSRAAVNLAIEKHR